MLDLYIFKYCVVLVNSYHFMASRWAKVDSVHYINKIIKIFIIFVIRYGSILDGTYIF